MYSNSDIARIDAECAAIRRTKLRDLDLKYEQKRKFEAEINKAIMDANMFTPYNITFEAVQGPYTVVQITSYLSSSHGAEEGLGVARCRKQDKYDAKKGRDMAIKKARRILARKLAGLLA